MWVRCDACGHLFDGVTCHVCAGNAAAAAAELLPLDDAAALAELSPAATPANAPATATNAPALAERLAAHAAALLGEVELLHAAGRDSEAGWLEDQAHELAAFAEEIRPGGLR